jgi:hypothetical protein
MDSEKMSKLGGELQTEEKKLVHVGSKVVGLSTDSRVV